MSYSSAYTDDPRSPQHSTLRIPSYERSPGARSDPGPCRRSREGSSYGPNTPIYRPESATSFDDSWISSSMTTRNPPEQNFWTLESHFPLPPLGPPAPGTAAAGNSSSNLAQFCAVTARNSHIATVDPRQLTLPQSCSRLTRRPNQNSGSGNAGWTDNEIMFSPLEPGLLSLSHLVSPSLVGDDFNHGLAESEALHVSSSTPLENPAEDSSRDMSTLCVQFKKFGPALGIKGLKPRKRRTERLPKWCRKYECELCGLTCNRKYNMDQHMRTHMKDRNREYLCTVEGCDSKGFFRQSDLRRHEDTVHRLSMPFKCKLCGKRSGRKDSLVRHAAFGCVGREQLKSRCATSSPTPTTASDGDENPTHSIMIDEAAWEVFNQASENVIKIQP